MEKLPRQWIEDRLGEGKLVQCAVTASNACHWAYLTTSGQVCREEYGYAEDADDWDETIDLPKLTWSTIRRLNRALEREYIGR